MSLGWRIVVTLSYISVGPVALSQHKSFHESLISYGEHADIVFVSLSATINNTYTHLGIKTSFSVISLAGKHSEGITKSKNLANYLNGESRTAFFMYIETLNQLQLALTHICSMEESTAFNWTIWKPVSFIIFQRPFQNSSLQTDILSNSWNFSSLNLNSEVYIWFASEANFSVNWTAREVYSFKDLLFFNTLSETSSLGLDIQNIILPKAKRRENLQQLPIKAVGLADKDYAPQLTLEGLPDGTVRFLSGFCFQLCLAMEYALNFTHIAVNGSGWVEEEANGTWTGMAAQILSDEAEISISQSSQVEYRLKKFTFLTQTIEGNIMAYFRQPDASSIRDILVGAFGLDLWCVLLFCWFGLIFSYRVCIWVHHRFDLSYPSDEELLETSGLYAVGVMTQKGLHVTPDSISMRIIFIFGATIGVVSYVAYSAALVSKLSVVVVPINSFDELADNVIPLFGDEWLPFTHHIVKDVYTHRGTPLGLDDKPYIDITEGIPKVLQRSLAFLTFADGFLTAFRHQNLNDSYYCSFVSSVIVNKAPQPSGTFVKKGSPLKEFFNHKIIMMYQRGLMYRLNNQYQMETRAFCPPELASLSHETQGINDLFTSYLVLFVGGCCSLLIAAVERIFHRFLCPEKQRVDTPKNDSNPKEIDPDTLIIPSMNDFHEFQKFPAYSIPIIRTIEVRDSTQFHKTCQVM